MKLYSSRLALESLSMKHLTYEYLGWLNNEKVIEYLEISKPVSLSDLEGYINRIIEENILMWAIVLKANNKHIGNIKMDPIDINSNSVELGIMIGDESEWGKGYAKETISLIIHYFFEELKFKQITLGVKNGHYNAVNLYKSMGFIENSTSGDSLRMILKKNN